MATLEGKWKFNDVITSAFNSEVSFTFVDTDGTTKNVTKMSFSYNGNYLIGNFTYDGTSTLVYDESRTTGSFWWHSKYKNIKVPAGYENATLLSFLETNAVEDKFEVIQRGVAGKIAILARIKNEIKEALANKGKVVNDDFTTYAQAITNLSSASAVSNINVDDDGIISWNPPNIYDLTNSSVIGYIINVNGTLLESTTNNVNGTNALINGSNTISVVAVISFENNGLETTLNYPKQMSVSAVKTLSYNSQYGSAVVIDGKIYIFGGRYSSSSSTYCNVIQCYDPLANVVTVMSSALPQRQYAYTSAVAIDGKAYIFGGHGYNQSDNDGDYRNYIQCFDPNEDSIKTINYLDKYLSRTSAVAIDGKAYIFGGKEATGSDAFNAAWDYSNSIRCYDPLNNTVTVLNGKLTSKRESTSAVVLYDEVSGTMKAYIFGGRGSTIFSDIQSFDPNNPNDNCQIISDVAITSGYNKSVSLNNRAYLFYSSTTAQIFSPKTQTIRNDNGKVITYISDGWAVVVNDTIYVCANKTINKVTIE